MTTHRALVPFELPDARPLSPVLAEALEAMDAVVLGHYNIPEQTPTAAARDQFEDDARAELEALARPLVERGVQPTSRLVFGKARDKTIDRVAVEEDCDVILTPGPVEALDRLFAPIRGEENFDRTLAFVAELLAATGASVTLFHAGEASDRLPGPEILANATDRLVETGVDPDRVERQLSEEGDARQSIVDLGSAYDLLVLGETEPSLADRIFGTVPSQVTAETEDPAFVVRSVEES